MSNSEPPSRKIWNWYPYKTNLLYYFTKFSSYHKFALKKVLFPFQSLVFYEFLSTWLAKIIYHIIVFDNSVFSSFQKMCYFSTWQLFSLYITNVDGVVILKLLNGLFEVSTNFLFQKKVLVVKSKFHSENLIIASSF